jgi:acetylornithine deacetylase/succinyl-diaminopimelate desuccinylase-like protein
VRNGDPSHHPRREHSLEAVGERELSPEATAAAAGGREEPVPSQHHSAHAPDMTLFETLGDIVRELDPAARPVPLLFPAVSDGRFFARLGIQTYGFLPMQLPEDLRFMELVHAEDERIPVDALEFGTSAIRQLLERFGEATSGRLSRIRGSAAADERQR